MSAIALFCVKHSSKKYPRAVQRQGRDRDSWLRTCAIEHKQRTPCEISGYRRGVNKIFAVLGCHAVKSGPRSGLLDP